PYELNGKHFDFHALRGMTATFLDEIGTPDGVRRKVMRHSTQTMTNLYTRPRDDQERQAIGRLADTLSAAGGATKSATDQDGSMSPEDANPDDSDSSGDGSEEGPRVQFPPPPLFPLFRQFPTEPALARPGPPWIRSGVKTGLVRLTACAFSRRFATLP